MFIQNLIINKNLSNYNINIVQIKTKSVIDMSDIDVYKEENLYIY